MGIGIEWPSGPGAAPRPEGWYDGGGRPGQYRMVIIRDGRVSSAYAWCDLEAALKEVSRAQDTVRRDPGRFGPVTGHGCPMEGDVPCWFGFTMMPMDRHGPGGPDYVYAVQKYCPMPRAYSVGWQP